MQTPKEVSQELTLYLERVLEHLYGHLGKNTGRHICYGDIYGSEGQSFKINATDPHRGCWKEFNGTEHGDLLDLWATVRRMSIADAMKDAQKWLGKPVKEKPMKTVPIPPQPEKLQMALSSDRGRDYLTQERKLSLQAIKAYQVCFDPGKDAVVFPYIMSAGGQPVHYKFLQVERKDGKKRMWSSKGSSPCLFGWQAIPPVCREVVITEGEIDSLSVASFGTQHFGLSIPNGCGDCSWIAGDFERLERMDTIYLMLDNDEHGQQHIKEIAERLGNHRTRVVRIPEPFVDANDCLTGGMTADQFKALLDEAEYFRPDGITSIKDIASQVECIVREGADSKRAIEMPFDKLYGKLRLRPEEVSVLVGINGHGKSELCTQIAIGAVKQNFKVAIASMEWSKPMCMYRLLRQAGGKSPEYLSLAYRDHIYQYYDDKLFLFGVTGTQRVTNMMDQMLDLRRRDGVELFVIDNMSKLGIDENDLNGQKQLMNTLTDFVNEHNCHVMLVCHPRKGEDEYSMVGKMDIGGSGAITNLAKTAFTVWRNVKKEYVLKKLNARPEIELDRTEQYYLKQPDTKLRVFKQNGGESWLGDCGLYFDSESQQFVERKDGRPKQYVDFSVLEDQQHG